MQGESASCGAAGARLGRGGGGGESGGRDGGEERHVRRALLARNLLLARQVAELSRAMAERNAVAERAQAALDSLVRKLLARLQVLQVPLGDKGGAQGWRDASAGAASAVTGLDQGPVRQEASWHLEALAKVGVALDDVSEVLKTPPKDVDDYFTDSGARAADGSSPGHSCLAHLREPAPLLNLEKALFRARAMIVAASRARDSVGEQSEEMESVDGGLGAADGRHHRSVWRANGVQALDEALEALYAAMLPGSKSSAGTKVS
jgi:hypothetical protein